MLHSFQMQFHRVAMLPSTGQNVDVLTWAPGPGPRGCCDCSAGTARAPSSAAA